MRVGIPAGLGDGSLDGLEDKWCVESSSKEIEEQFKKCVGHEEDGKAFTK